MHQKINSLCGLFLWNGTSEGHHTARVEWETVTLTEDQGRLSVRDLILSNTSCILLLFFWPTSLWASYFKEVILKGDISSFWSIKPSRLNSWLVNKLIKNRDLCYPLIKQEWEMDSARASGTTIGLRSGASTLSSPGNSMYCNPSISLHWRRLVTSTC